MSDDPSSGSSRKRRKTMNACINCRQHKLKCSGDDPCQRCLSKNMICTFEAKLKKVTISED
ncbi:hypothetical protein KJ359_001037 [Pestalotiopsis sp. 9143b]|nr:hypothetical protein KJ359_001037 [Pestalotiopsis sp. 9143b]